VQSLANSWAGGLALKFSPREVLCGGDWSCAKVSDSGHSASRTATAATQNQAFDRNRPFIFNNNNLHARRN
jgi:hypothetical protein